MPERDPAVCQALQVLHRRRARGLALPRRRRPSSARAFGPSFARGGCSACGSAALRLLCAFAGIVCSVWAPTARAREPQGRWPAGFVALEEVAGSIVQEMRYAGPSNFTGQPVPGYDAPRCLLTRQAALALREVDAELAAFGLGLKVYDCYRPARAVAAMLRWAQAEGPLSATERWFLPALGRAEVVSHRYLARRSGHSRGSTVDLTIVTRGSGPRPLQALPAQQASCLDEAVGGGDSGISFGTAHDCFDPNAHTHAPGLSAGARTARALLVLEMQRAGFVGYSKEWWHFTLQHEPHPDTVFDFVIR